MGKIIYIFSLSLLFFLAPFSLHAATLFLSPSSYSSEVGNTFSVNVHVGSADQSMNAASGIITFPAQNLEVVSVSKSGSIFTLWPEEPTFSNTSGQVKFEGVVFNPGFTGSSGKILSITFKTKKAGSANLNITSAAVLANDGTGTDILTSTRGASATLRDRQAPPPSIQLIEPEEKIQEVPIIEPNVEVVMPPSPAPYLNMNMSKETRTDMMLQYLYTATLLLCIVSGLTLISLYMWFRIFKVMRHFRKNVRDTEKMSEKSLNALRKDIKLHIARLRAVESKRKLTREEISFLEKFEEKLANVETGIVKRIREIDDSSQRG